MLTLSLNNVVEYLSKKSFFKEPIFSETNLKIIPAKNFNILLNCPDGKKILVKQERLNLDGTTYREFINEWQIQEFLSKFPELKNLRQFLPEIIYFDVENSILVSNYLDCYLDLADFYWQEKQLPTVIASFIGKTLGEIHSLTFHNQNYQKCFIDQEQKNNYNPVLYLIKKLQKITPEAFGSVPADGLKFFSLYQRFDSLGQAIEELEKFFSPSCLTHNDLKLNNILLHKEWKNKTENLVRFIDWERSAWGDPAFDLGMLIGSYTQLWLNSLIISKSLTIEESLNLATISIEMLQPSLRILMLAYLETFPHIIEVRPDFLKRVIQFIGFSLIQQIHTMIQYQKSFGNWGIATLQVAKSLLCRPEASSSTIFGSACTQFSSINV